MQRTEKKKLTKSFYLIMLCWLVYSCSYIGKLSFNANIIQIEGAYGVSHDLAGMISTFFFFAYGAGQIVNGFFCKKYNIKYVIFASLIVSSLMNVLVVVSPSFDLLKYFWLINGIAMSFLWTALIRLLSEVLPKKELRRAIVIMGTTVATGTFIVYGLSALFAAFDLFRLTFFIAAAVMALVALVWLFSYTPLVKSLLKDKEHEVDEEEKLVSPLNREEKRSPILPLIIILAFFAIANNFVKDGLTAWTPNILKELYNTPSWLSILLTLLLPAMAIGGAVVAVNVHKRIKDFVLTLLILFSSAALLFAVVNFLVGGTLSTITLIITIAVFSIVSCLMAGVNNVITSMVPLYENDRINSGKLAGILNGFCYLGSTVSTYGLGYIATKNGWHAVFSTLLIVCSAVIVIGIIYIIPVFIRKRRK